MSTGLIALLDDVAVIARAAAASLDDVGVVAAKAGSKAAGVVIDDAAVTPRYVTDFSPDRELPIIWKITKGSLRNKLLILLPAALILSEFFPWAITPLLMLGGLFLCYEGAEKVLEKLGGTEHGATLDDPISDPVAFERERVSGAIRTDMILSAEIMAITLASLTETNLFERAVVLALVGIVITVGVYGVVALIVKMDDIGLALTKRASGLAQATGRFLLKAMPVVLDALAAIGTVAMLWVGGGILLHGLESYHVPGPPHWAHALQVWMEQAGGSAGGALGWLAYAVASALFGLIAGWIVTLAVHKLPALVRKSA